MAIAAILLVGVTIGATLLITGSSEKQETTVFVEQIQNLATLATAKAHIKVVKENTDNNFFGMDIDRNLFGTERKTLLIIPATVVAGIDLKQVTAEDIQVNEETKELQIVLPRATFLQEPAILMEDVQFHSDEGLFSAELPAEEVLDLAAIAQKDIEAEATEIGLLETAEESAVLALNGFFSNLDYKVNVTFE